MAKETTTKEKFLIFMQIVTIAMGIYSICMIAIAYNELADAVTDFNDVTDNWKEQPITSVASSTDGTCTSGYTKWTTLKFPGIDSGACACGSSASFTEDGQTYTQSSSLASCNTNQTKAGCYSDPSVSSSTMNFYRGLTLCVKRDGVGSVESWSPYKERPYPSGGSCTSGYQYCGATGGSFDGNKGICVPDDSECPITSLEVDDSITTDYTNIADGINQNFGDNEYDKTHSTSKFNYGKQIDGDLPIVDIAFGFVKRDSTKGICYGQDPDLMLDFTSEYDWTSTAAGDRPGPRPDPTFPSKCDTYDTRYILVDSYPLENFVYENMAQSSSCDNTYDMTTDLPDYWKSGTQCPYTSTSSDCVATSNIGCSSSDNICKSVQYQSNCGKLLGAAEVSNDFDIGIYVRREIYWKSDCTVDKEYIKNLESPINSALSAQLALMIISIIINVIVSCFFPVVTIWNLQIGDAPCIPGEGEAEAKIIKAQKTYVGHALRIIKAIPMIVCVVIIANIKSKVEGLGNLDCTASDDELTGETFDFIAEALPKVFSANIQALVMDLLQILMFVALQIKEALTGGDTEEKEEHVELKEATVA